MRGGSDFNRTSRVRIHPESTRTLLPSDSTWEQFIRDGLTGLLRCDGVALLPGWSTSKGARIEWSLARAVGLDVREIDEWLAQSGGAS